MRYIIIPLAIILYCIWTYKAFKNNHNSFDTDDSVYSFTWTIIHLAAIVTFLLIYGSILTIKYW